MKFGGLEDLVKEGKECEQIYWVKIFFKKLRK